MITQTNTQTKQAQLILLEQGSRKSMMIRFVNKGLEKTDDDLNIFAGHTGGNPGGSSTPSCTKPLWR